MNCGNFQDLLSDYLDGAVDSRTRAECAAHRLVCRDCRELYNDVRVTVQALGNLAVATVEPEGLQTRILAATTAGEMLSCNEFDQLIERYFDGVMLAPDHQAFQSHFEYCTKCRRLLSGIEEAIELCREVKETEVEMPSSLPDRIVMATTGKRSTRFKLFWGAGFAVALFNRLLSPQWAAAGLICAASLLLVSLRFGSLEGFAAHANGRAELLLNELNQTGIQARDSLNRVSFPWANAPSTAQKAAPQPAAAPVQPTAPVLQPAASTGQAPQCTPTPKLQRAVRYERQR
jgi:predicted anti-sigma-YlaC factor YlaD